MLGYAITDSDVRTLVAESKLSREEIIYMFIDSQNNLIGLQAQLGYFSIFAGLILTAASLIIERMFSNGTEKGL